MIVTDDAFDSVSTRQPGGAATASPAPSHVQLHAPAQSTLATPKSGRLRGWDACSPTEIRYGAPGRSGIFARSLLFRKTRSATTRSRSALSARGSRAR